MDATEEKILIRLISIIIIDINQPFYPTDSTEENGRFIRRFSSGIVVFQKLRQPAAILQDSR